MNEMVAVVEMWEQAGTESDDIAALAAADLAALLGSDAISSELANHML